MILSFYPAPITFQNKQTGSQAGAHFFVFLDWWTRQKFLKYPIMFDHLYRCCCCYCCCHRLLFHESSSMLSFYHPAYCFKSLLPMYHLRCALQKYPVLSHKINIIIPRTITRQAGRQANRQTCNQSVSQSPQETTQSDRQTSILPFKFCFPLNTHTRTQTHTHLCNVRVHARIINIYIYIHVYICYLSYF